jgi:hypothetical protein
MKGLVHVWDVHIDPALNAVAMQWRQQWQQVQCTAPRLLGPCLWLSMHEASAALRLLCGSLSLHMLGKPTARQHGVACRKRGEQTGQCGLAGGCRQGVVVITDCRHQLAGSELAGAKGFNEVP